LLMGYGARMALGCNIGGLFSSISSLSLSGWVFAIAVAIGAFIGGKIIFRVLI
ncbi:MAG: YeeE/YedE family protein, partial [Tissierellia bacterium]|nr:YeeE/YedE family protein [Tissierellia bacterium]